MSLDDLLLYKSFTDPADYGGTYSVSYAPEDVFSALKSILTYHAKFILVDCSDFTMTMHLRTKMSWRTNGENIYISVESSPAGTAMLTIRSQLKMGIADWGKNKMNVDEILSLLQSELSRNYSRYEPPTPEESTVANDPANRLLKLKKLLDEGIISQAEYESKRQALLSQL